MQFNNELDPWKRIERNINIRAAQAKYDIARMAALAKMTINHRDILMSEFALKDLIERSVKWLQQDGNVRDMRQYRERAAVKRSYNITIPRKLDVDPYNVYSNSKLYFPKHEWVYSFEKPDETDPK